MSEREKDFHKKANRFSVLEGLQIYSIDDTLVKIKDSIKASLAERLGILETQK